MKKWIILASAIIALASVSYPAWPWLRIPICGDWKPVRPGTMMVTGRNTVICPNFDAAVKLSSMKKPMIDLPPYVLMSNGCHPAAKVLGLVAEVKGDFLALQLPHATDKTRKWWTPVVTASSEMPRHI